jgi:ketosteroid isomerase-like protein
MRSVVRPVAEDTPPAKNERSESANLLAIREAFRASVDDGFEAGLEWLLSLAREDCEFRPYIGSDRVLRGHDEIRRYYGEAIAAGTEMRLKPTTFYETGDDIVVDGTIRVARPTGGFSESQISWTYKFREGRLTEVGWSPRRTG